MAKSQRFPRFFPECAASCDGRGVRELSEGVAVGVPDVEGAEGSAAGCCEGRRCWFEDEEGEEGEHGLADEGCSGHAVPGVGEGGAVGITTGLV